MVGGRTQENLATAQALQNQAFSDPQNPLRITNPQALNQLTQMITSGPLGFAPAGITAFHGSPYLFRQFDPAKVGTGEGAQAYGVGSGYTAEARPVAEDYARRIIKREDPDNYAMNNVANRLYKGGFDDEYIKNRLKTVFPEIKDDQINASIKTAKSPEAAGYLYKGDIPDEILPKFLDWDKPLSQQSEDVINVLKRRVTDVQPTDKFDMGGNARLRDNRNGKVDPKSTSPWLMETTDASGTKFFGLTQKDVDRMFGSKDAKDLTGEQIYARLTQDQGSQQAASAYLESIGVRGIRYLDQVSRGEGKGTSNFIPFRPEDFKIQEINDIPIEDYIAKGLL